MGAGARAQADEEGVAGSRPDGQMTNEWGNDEWGMPNDERSVPHFSAAVEQAWEANYGCSAASLVIRHSAA
jgi:hypothetical protein